MYNGYIMDTHVRMTAQALRHTVNPARTHDKAGDEYFYEKYSRCH